MRTVKWAAIWVGCGLIPVAFVFTGLLPDADVYLPRLIMPMFMVSLFLWLMAGLVMFATWQDNRPNHRS